MPAGRRIDKEDYLQSWEAFDKIFSAQPVSPDSPEDTPFYRSPFPTRERERPMAPEPFSTPMYSHPSSSSNTEPETPADSDSLDHVWSELRRRKERTMARSPGKIKSLEQAFSASEQPIERFHSPPPDVPPARPQLKRRKSHVTFRESPDSRRVMAIFSLPDVKKEDMHVSYQVDRLVVTWQTVKVTERMEDGKMLRDREESKFSRTIPLPEGTKFEEIHASRDQQRLILTYPNMRAVRARPRPVDGS